MRISILALAAAVTLGFALPAAAGDDGRRDRRHGWHHGQQHFSDHHRDRRDRHRGGWQHRRHGDHGDHRDHRKHRDHRDHRDHRSWGSIVLSFPGVTVHSPAHRRDRHRHDWHHPPRGGFYVVVPSRDRWDGRHWRR